MSRLFESTTMNRMILKNRFVRSATYEGMADDAGFVTDRLTEYIVDLAKGGVGLIITGHAYVSSEGQAGPWQMGIHDDELLPGLTSMTKAVHDNGGLIVLQLAHAGASAATELSGIEAIGPSPFEGGDGKECLSMTRDDIKEIITKYSHAAGRAQKAGFDGIQIHAAHGYLLNQFLSPFFNKREDKYGGEIQNRARIVLEIIQGIRKIVGDTYPILVKLNSEDFVEGGFSTEDMLAVGKMFEQYHIDAIEMSGGTLFHSGANNPIREGRLTPDNEGFYLKAAKQYKDTISIPLILVGGIRSFDLAERLINENSVDYISLSRPLIREPDLINRWRSGDHSPAACISDNLCIKPVFEGCGVCCPFVK